KEALMLPPVDLDALLDKKLVDQAIGGYDVYSAPYITYPILGQAGLPDCSLAKSGRRACPTA
ncbi:MAG: hypothetical protein KJ994_05540, partial [Candidatus Omnitrophica bacterium]|nr:hypothetical protein [Candidatus Omnitrophota bacterium]MBU1038496.1 hypothetical protein [Candidatus Omnitrophota bacterium]